MAYDEELADRVRALLSSEDDVREQKMFGGLGFMVTGNMAVAPLGEGGLMVRVDPAEGERLIAAGKAAPMEMRGRTMTGWLRLETSAVRTESQLKRWVSIGTAYARSLPPKPKKKPKSR